MHHRLLSRQNIAVLDIDFDIKFVQCVLVWPLQDISFADANNSRHNLDNLT